MNPKLVNANFDRLEEFTRLKNLQASNRETINLFKDLITCHRDGSNVIKKDDIQSKLFEINDLVEEFDLNQRKFCQFASVNPKEYLEQKEIGFKAFRELKIFKADLMEICDDLDVPIPKTQTLGSRYVPFVHQPLIALQRTCLPANKPQILFELPEIEILKDEESNLNLNAPCNAISPSYSFIGVHCTQAPVANVADLNNVLHNSSEAEVCNTSLNLVETSRSDQHCEPFNEVYSDENFTSPIFFKDEQFQIETSSLKDKTPPSLIEIARVGIAPCIFKPAHAIPSVFEENNLTVNSLNAEQPKQPTTYDGSCTPFVQVNSQIIVQDYKGSKTNQSSFVSNSVVSESEQKSPKCNLDSPIYQSCKTAPSRHSFFKSNPFKGVKGIYKSTTEQKEHVKFLVAFILNLKSNSTVEVESSRDLEPSPFQISYKRKPPKTSAWRCRQYLISSEQSEHVSFLKTYMQKINSTASSRCLYNRTPPAQFQGDMVLNICKGRSFRRKRRFKSHTINPFKLNQRRLELNKPNFSFGYSRYSRSEKSANNLNHGNFPLEVSKENFRPPAEFKENKLHFKIKQD